MTAALAGKTAQLEDLLSRFGGYGVRPNLRLAAAFGAEVSALPGTVAGLLDRLGANDAAPDQPQVFLPGGRGAWMGRPAAREAGGRHRLGRAGVAGRG